MSDQTDATIEPRFLAVQYVPTWFPVTQIWYDNVLRFPQFADNGTGTPPQVGEIRP